MEQSISDDFIGQRKRRIQNLEELKKLGYLNYPPNSQKKLSHSNFINDFSKYENSEVIVAGRIVNKREHGKLTFIDVVDETAVIQVALKSDSLCSDINNNALSYEHLQYIDTGDIVEINGNLSKSSRGAITIFAKNMSLLTKSVRPYPATFDNKEEQFRKRYIDFIVNKDKKNIFIRKGKFWNSIRNFLISKGFHELYLPILEHTTGGADAKPFVTHHNELNEDLYLRISLELYSKRAIGSGFDKVFVIGTVFRNEGMSDEHANEYTMMESYEAYANYRDGMQMVKEMYQKIAQEVYGRTKFTTRSHTFDLQDSWKEIDYASIIKERFDIDIFADSEEKMLEVIKKEGIHIEGANRVRIIDNLWKAIRKTISGPAFLINQPKFISPLAKVHTEKPEITQRFQVILAGSEIGNGYSELNDPFDQLERFKEQERLRENGDEEAQMLDSDFVEMLEYGMPPTCGFGVSERLFWFLEDITAREGTMFPILRNEEDQMNKKIYNINVGSKNQNSEASYIILDFDGVIADSSEADLHASVKLNLAKDLTSAFERRTHVHKQVNHFTSENLDKNEHESFIKHVKEFNDAMLEVNPKLFLDFVHELKNLSNAKLAIVSNGTKDYILKLLGTNSQLFTHILSYDDHHSKVERVKTILSDWKISKNQTYFITDTVRDILEMEMYLPKENLYGVAWGWHGKSILQEVLPNDQIFDSFKDIQKLQKITLDKNILQKRIDSKSLKITRSDALELLNKYIPNKNLINHCLCVEAFMKALAVKLHGDEKLWEMAGLLHDADWEVTRNEPHNHTHKTIEWLKSLGEDNSELIQSIYAHATHVNGKEGPKSLLDWALYCGDELTGLIVATALMTPHKKLSEVTEEKVLKKFNTKGFAAGVDREQIKLCKEKLNIGLEEFVAICLKSMQNIASQINL